MKSILFIVLILGSCATKSNKSFCTEMLGSGEGRVIFAVAEKAPHFKGGQESLDLYIKQNLDKPNECHEGAVYIHFVVEAQGSITEARVVKGITEETDTIALNLIKNMPNWVPGECQDKPIAHFVVIPVKFSL